MKKKEDYLKHTKGLGHHDLSANLPVDQDLTKDFNEIVSGKSKKIKPFDINLDMNF